jgi:hypothetical protein
MSILMIAGCLAVATLALLLSLLCGDALRRERRDEAARRERRARVFRQPVLVATHAGAERRVAARPHVEPERRRAA